VNDLIEVFKNNPKLALPLLAFLFPTVFGAGSSGMELYQSIITGTEWGKSHTALEQKQLWEANINCMQDNKFTYITNDHNVKIGTVVCASGDVLISAQKPDEDHPSFKWVSWGNISAEQAFFSIIPQAQAGTIVNSYYSGGYLVQEIVDNGVCVRYYINPHNGVVQYSEYC